MIPTTPFDDLNLNRNLNLKPTDPIDQTTDPIPVPVNPIELSSYLDNPNLTRMRMPAPPPEDTPIISDAVLREMGMDVFGWEQNTAQKILGIGRELIGEIPSLLPKSVQQPVGGWLEALPLLGIYPDIPDPKTKSEEFGRAVGHLAGLGTSMAALNMLPPVAFGTAFVAKTPKVGPIAAAGFHGLVYGALQNTGFPIGSTEDLEQRWRNAGAQAVTFAAFGAGAMGVNKVVGKRFEKFLQAKLSDPRSIGVLKEVFNMYSLGTAAGLYDGATRPADNIGDVLTNAFAEGALGGPLFVLGSALGQQTLRPFGMKGAAKTEEIIKDASNKREVMGDAYERGIISNPPPPKPTYIPFSQKRAVDHVINQIFPQTFAHAERKLVSEDLGNLNKYIDAQLNPKAPIKGAGVQLDPTKDIVIDESMPPTPPSDKPSDKPFGHPDNPLILKTNNQVAQDNVANQVKRGKTVNKVEKAMKHPSVMAALRINPELEATFREQFKAQYEKNPAAFNNSLIEATASAHQLISLESIQMRTERILADKNKTFDVFDLNIDQLRELSGLKDKKSIVEFIERNQIETAGQVKTKANVAIQRSKSRIARKSANPYKLSPEKKAQLQNLPADPLERADVLRRLTVDSTGGRIDPNLNTMIEMTEAAKETIANTQGKARENAIKFLNGVNRRVEKALTGELPISKDIEVEAVALEKMSSEAAKNPILSDKDVKKIEESVKDAIPSEQNILKRVVATAAKMLKGNFTARDKANAISEVEKLLNARQEDGTITEGIHAAFPPGEGIYIVPTHIGGRQTPNITGGRETRSTRSVQGYGRDHKVFFNEYDAMRFANNAKLGGLGIVQAVSRQTLLDRIRRPGGGTEFVEESMMGADNLSVLMKLLEPGISSKDIQAIYFSDKADLRALDTWVIDGINNSKDIYRTRSSERQLSHGFEEAKAARYEELLGELRREASYDSKETDVSFSEDSFFTRERRTALKALGDIARIVAKPDGKTTIADILHANFVGIYSEFGIRTRAEAVGTRRKARDRGVPEEELLPIESVRFYRDAHIKGLTVEEQRIIERYNPEDAFAHLRKNFPNVQDVNIYEPIQGSIWTANARPALLPPGERVAVMDRYKAERKALTENYKRDIAASTNNLERVNFLKDARDKELKRIDDYYNEKLSWKPDSSERVYTPGAGDYREIASMEAAVLQGRIDVKSVVWHTSNFLGKDLPFKSKLGGVMPGKDVSGLDYILDRLNLDKSKVTPEEYSDSQKLKRVLEISFEKNKDVKKLFELYDENRTAIEVYTDTVMRAIETAESMIMGMRENSNMPNAVPTKAIYDIMMEYGLLDSPIRVLDGKVVVEYPNTGPNDNHRYMLELGKKGEYDGFLKRFKKELESNLGVLSEAKDTLSIANLPYEISGPEAMKRTLLVKGPDGVDIPVQVGIYRGKSKVGVVKGRGEGKGGIQERDVTYFLNKYKRGQSLRNTLEKDIETIQRVLDSIDTYIGPAMDGKLTTDAITHLKNTHRQQPAIEVQPSNQRVSEMGEKMAESNKLDPKYRLTPEEKAAEKDALDQHIAGNQDLIMQRLLGQASKDGKLESSDGFDTKEPTEWMDYDAFVRIDRPSESKPGDKPLTKADYEAFFSDRMGYKPPKPGEPTDGPKLDKDGPTMFGDPYSIMIRGISGFIKGIAKAKSGRREPPKTTLEAVGRSTEVQELDPLNLAYREVRWADHVGREVQESAMHGATYLEKQIADATGNIHPLESYQKIPFLKEHSHFVNPKFIKDYISGGFADNMKRYRRENLKTWLKMYSAGEAIVPDVNNPNNIKLTRYGREGGIADFKSLPPGLQQATINMRLWMRASMLELAKSGKFQNPDQVEKRDQDIGYMPRKFIDFKTGKLLGSFGEKPSIQGPDKRELNEDGSNRNIYQLVESQQNKFNSPITELMELDPSVAYKHYIMDYAKQIKALAITEKLQTIKDGDTGLPIVVYEGKGYVTSGNWKIEKMDKATALRLGYEPIDTTLEYYQQQGYAQRDVAKLLNDQFGMRQEINNKVAKGVVESYRRYRFVNKAIQLINPFDNKLHFMTQMGAIMNPTNNVSGVIQAVAGSVGTPIGWLRGIGVVSKATVDTLAGRQISELDAQRMREYGVNTTGHRLRNAMYDNLNPSHIDGSNLREGQKNNLKLMNKRVWELLEGIAYDKLGLDNYLMGIAEKTSLVMFTRAARTFEKSLIASQPHLTEAQRKDTGYKMAAEYTNTAFDAPSSYSRTAGFAEATKWLLIARNRSTTRLTLGLGAVGALGEAILPANIYAGENWLAKQIGPQSNNWFARNFGSKGFNNAELKVLNTMYLNHMNSSIMGWFLTTAVMSKALSDMWPWELPYRNWFDINSGAPDGRGGTILVSNPFFKDIKDNTEFMMNFANGLSGFSNAEYNRFAINKMDPSLASLLEMLSGTEISTNGVRAIPAKPFLKTGAEFYNSRAYHLFHRVMVHRGVFNALSDFAPQPEPYARPDYGWADPLANFFSVQMKSSPGVGREETLELIKEKETLRHNSAAVANMERNLERAMQRGDYETANRINQMLHHTRSGQAGYLLRRANPSLAKRLDRQKKSLKTRAEEIRMGQWPE